MSHSLGVVVVVGGVSKLVYLLSQVDDHICNYVHVFVVVGLLLRMEVDTRFELKRKGNRKLL